jgi:hypothetical protein
MDELKRGKDRAHAFSLIQKSPKFFTDSRKFIDYISHIPLQRTEHLVRITGLLEVGIEPSLILNSTQRLRQAIHSGNPEVMLEAVRELSKNIGSDGTTSDVTLAGLAEALDNEKLTADIDQVSLLAVQSLLKVRTHNGNVNKSLLKSAKYEENLDIKYTAAAALFLNGIHIDEAASVLEEIQSSQGLSDATKNLVQTYLSAHDAPQCRDLFSLFGTRKENRP